MIEVNDGKVEKKKFDTGDNTLVSIQARKQASGCSSYGGRFGPCYIK